MINILYGEENEMQFKEYWVPLIHTITQTSTIFNWACIFLASMAQAISKAKKIAPGVPLTFFMSSYLLDIAYVVNIFSRMGWQWQPNEALIHVYCQILWECHFIIHYTKIYENFIAPMYKLIFYEPTQCMTKKTMHAISEVGDWYVTKRGIYIQIFGAIKAPHLLPKFIHDNLSLEEVAYQTCMHDLGASLSRNKKSLWFPLPFHIGAYGFKDVREAVAEVVALTTFHFSKERIKRHNLLNIVGFHFHSCKY